MAILLSLDDFKVDYHIQFQNNKSIWQSRLDTYEELELRKLLGEDLYNDFNTNPLDPKFNDIKKPFISDGYECRGLQLCILSFVYCRLIKHNGIYMPQSAQAVRGETVQKVDIQENYARAWNSGVYDAVAIASKMGICFENDYYQLTRPW